MASRGAINVYFRALGAAQLRNTMRGVATEARRADQQTTASARAAERERLRIAREEARVRSGLARDGARAAERAERERVRSAREAARLINREEAALFREQSRRTALAARDLRRQQQTQRRRQSAIDSGVATGLAGFGMAAVFRSLDAFRERVDTITSALGSQGGVLDPGQASARAQTFGLQMARSADEFFQGQDPAQQAQSMEALRLEIDAIARATGESPTGLLDVLSSMQTHFSMFEIGRRDLAAIAEEAQRTGASMEDLGTFVGLVNQQLGDAAPTAERLFDIMAQQGLASSVAPGDLAEHFGGQLGNFRDVTGLQGEDAIRQFGAIANATASADPSHPSEAATRMQNLLSSLGQHRTIDRIRQATGGHQVGHGRARHWEGGTGAITTDEAGNQRIDMMQLIDDLSAVPGVGSTDAIFRDQGARRAMGTLIDLRNRREGGEAGIVDAQALAGVDAEQGAAFRQRGIDRVMNTSAIAWQRRGVNSEIAGQTLLPEREAQAAQVSDFRQGADELGISPMIPDAFAAPIGGLIARNTSAQTRRGMRGLPVLGGLGGLALADLGDAAARGGQIGASVTHGGAAAGAVGAAAPGAVRPTELAPGTTVKLDPGTIDAIARAVGQGAPATGREPGGPGRR